MNFFLAYFLYIACLLIIPTPKEVHPLKSLFWDSQILCVLVTWYCQVFLLRSNITPPLCKQMLFYHYWSLHLIKALAQSQDCSICMRKIKHCTLSLSQLSIVGYSWCCEEMITTLITQVVLPRHHMWQDMGPKTLKFFV